MSAITTVSTAVSTVKSTVTKVTSTISKIGTFFVKHWKFVLVVLIILGVGYGVNQIFNSFVISKLQKDMATLQATNKAISNIASDWAEDLQKEDSLNQQLEADNAILKSALVQSQAEVITIKKLLTQSEAIVTDVGKDIDNAKDIISGVADEIGKVIKGAK